MLRGLPEPSIGDHVGKFRLHRLDIGRCAISVGLMYGRFLSMVSGSVRLETQFLLRCG